MYIYIYIYTPEWKCNGSLSLYSVSASAPMCFFAPVPLHPLPKGAPQKKLMWILLKGLMGTSIPQNAVMWDTFEGLKKNAKRVQFE